MSVNLQIDDQDQNFTITKLDTKVCMFHAKSPLIINNKVWYVDECDNAS